MLYQPEAFEPLTEEPWSEPRVRDSIRELVADVDSAFRGPRLFWRADEWDRWKGTSPMKNLFVGSAGVLWALDALRRRGHAETTLDLADLAIRNVELFRARPDFTSLKIALPEPKESALLEGETGILLVALRLAPPRADLADDLLERVRANVSNVAEEVMWGTPGTLIAARAMLEWTGEERWRDACRESADALWSRRDADGLWVRGSTTAPIGTSGRCTASSATCRLSRPSSTKRVARDSKTRPRASSRTRPCSRTVSRTGRHFRGKLVARDGVIRLQWCHGAPGVVSVAASYLDEELLLAGAALCWRAGPHGPEKGYAICHGTAGNGYALLKAFERTGDDLWLDRARRFAVHALGQVARARVARGSGRYSLWTGDLAVALYAADCLDGRSRYPFFDADALG